MAIDHSDSLIQTFMEEIIWYDIRTILVTVEDKYTNKYALIIPWRSCLQSGGTDSPCK